MTATAVARGPGAAVTAPLFAVAAFSALAGWSEHAAGDELLAVTADPAPAPGARTRHHGPQSFAVA